MPRRSVPSRTVAALLAALLLTVALSGCTATNLNDDNTQPNADLKVNKTSGFNGDAFEFDGRDSKDPDGHVATWRFDFGDGATFETNSSDKAKVTHKYVRGGEYTARLTVIDDGADRVGQQTATNEVTIKVNERRPISSAVLYAAPANQAGTAQTNQTFTAAQGVDRYDLNVTVRSVLVAGSSEVRIRVIDPDGKTIGDKNETVQAGQTQEVKLEDETRRVGDYTIWITAVSGATSLTGEVRVYYDK